MASEQGERLVRVEVLSRFYHAREARVVCVGEQVWLTPAEAWAAYGRVRQIGDTETPWAARAGWR